MAKTKAELEAELDALIAELGDPIEVRTRGPKHVGGMQDQLDASSLTVLAGVAQSKGDTSVRTRRKAVEWARDQARDATVNWHGMCLAFVRSCFNIDPLYPDARTAWEEAQHKHRGGDTGSWPRGHAGFFQSSSEHWHVVFCLGNDRGLSSDADADDPGGIGYVVLSQLAAAWRMTPLGTTDDVNGEPAPAPRPRQRQSGIEWRRRFLHRALVHARSAGNQARARRIRQWLDLMRRRA